MIRHISIRYKIILMVLAIFIFIAGLSFTIFSISESRKQKKNLEREALFLAKFTADYCTAPLVFGIKEETTEVLNNLSSNPAVMYTAVYTSNGVLFDSYNPNTINIPANLNIIATLDSVSIISHIDSLHFFNEKSLLIKLPVVYEGMQHGTIVMAYSLSQARISLKRSMRTAAYITLIILVIVYLLAFLFQRIISDPILALASVTDKIKKDANYTLRLKKRNNDEIGILYDRFNNMLEQIEFRDKNRDETEEMLKEAKNLAENADKLKSAFLANMSHEIRTPLNGILGFSGLLDNDELSTEERKYYIEVINQSSNQLLTIVDDILSISRLETGQIEVLNEQVNINGMLQDMFAKYNLKTSERNITLSHKKDLDDKQSILFSDSDKLRQILDSLLSNAFKFTSEGYVLFGYSFKGEYLEFYVEDTGIGIPEDHKNIIFDHFTLKSSNKTQKSWLRYDHYFLKT